MELIITSSEDGAQVPLEIVHLKTFIPVPSPVTLDEGFDGVEIVPDPLINVHAPVPEDAVLPLSTVLVPHTVWSEPAFAAVGKLSETTVTSAMEGLQVPFEIVHLNIFVPLLKPVIKLPGLVAFAKVPLPLISDQMPVPMDGVFAAIVASVSQIV